jgi:signal transduction histidine kinase
VAALAATHMLVVGVTMPEVMGQFTLQLVYFVAILSGVSWAQDRRLMTGVIGAIVLAMFVWIALQFAVGSAIQELVDDSRGTARNGVIAPIPAAVALTLVINAAYFGGAVLGGQISWRNARQKALLAEQAATIRAQSDTLRRRAVTDERLRIARELHDALGHHLTALTLNLEAALVRTDGAAHGDVEKAQSLARTLLADVRAIVAEKNADDCLDLTRALRTLVADLPRPRVQLEVDDALRVDDPEQGLVILRCVQEVVTNAARHSGAANLWITVRRTAGAFEVHARDDGRGRATIRDGFGLRGMRERIERAGGALTIESGAGRGFALTAFLPARSGS